MNSEIHPTARETEQAQKGLTGTPRGRGRLPGAGLIAAAALLLLAAAASADDMIRPRDSLDLGKEPDVYAFALSPDGKNVAVFARSYTRDSDWDNKVAVWDVQAKKRLTILKEDGWDAGRVFAYTSDGGSLLVLGARLVGIDTYRPSVAFCDAKTYAMSRTVDLDADPDMRQAVFTPDCKSLIVGTRSFGVWIYDLQTGKKTNGLPCDEGPGVAEIVTLALSADGRTLAVGTHARNVFLFDVAKGKLLQKMHTVEAAELLAFSPDGKRLVSTSAGGNEGALEVWDKETGKNIDILRVSSIILRDPYALAFSPDGKTLGMVGELGAPELWDVAQSGFRDDFRAHIRSGDHTRLAFSPDGKTLVTAGMGVTVEFWDLPAGAPKGVRRDTTPPPLVPPAINLPHR